MSDDREIARADEGGAEHSAPPVDFAEPEFADTPLLDATLGTLVTTLQAFSYSAPMPPSSEYDAYDRVLPGTALVIRTMAVDEQKHRHSLEDREMALRENGQDAAIRLSSRGQLSALGVILIAAALCGYLAHLGEAGYGIAAVLFAIGCVAAVVALGRFDPPWKSAPKQNNPPE